MRWIALLSWLVSLFTVCFTQGCLPGCYPAENYEPKCFTRLELVFIIDSSHSINVKDPQNFASCLGFVKDIVSHFEVMDTLTRVGVISYSNKAHVQMTLAASTDKKKVLNAIGGIPHQNTGTKTGIALFEAIKLFSQSRPKVRKALIVLTDGMSGDDSITPSKALKKAGVEIFVIGVGDMYRKPDLVAIATDGNHVFTADFKSLKAIEKTLKKMVCEPPSVVYKSQCPCCGDLYTCTVNDVKAGFPCNC